MNDDDPMPLIVHHAKPRIRESARVLGIPWHIIAPHEKQAVANHGQTLKRLRERGGLSPCEAVAVLEDRKWEPMDDAAAFLRLADIIRDAPARWTL